MKNLSKKLISIFMLFILIITSTPLTVYAGADPNKLGKVGKKRAKELYQYLISNGYTKQAACGILANADAESGFEISIDDSGTYKGTFQFDSTQASSIKKWAKKNKLDPDNSTVQFKWIEANVLNGALKTYGSTTLKEFKKISDVDEATSVFCASYERCVCFSVTTGAQNCRDHRPDEADGCKKANWCGKSLYFQHLGRRQQYGRKFLKAYAKIDPVNKSGSNKVKSSVDSNGKDTSGLVVNKGTYGLVDPATGTFISLDESVREFIEREDLTKDQIKGVSDWKNNIDYENDDTLLKFIRVIVMFLGICFIVWIVLIYLCYWMDRINNFVDIDFLPIITGGRLRVSPEEFECTFNPKEFIGKKEPQTVNHRAILMICVIGLFFGVLVISGRLYDVINYLVRKVLGWLGL